MAVKEDKVKRDIMKAFGRVMRLWMCPVGYAWQKASDGTFFRFFYGLAKGNADIIGIYPRVITQADVGKTIGQFVSIEVKRPGAKGELRPDQVIWFNVIRRFGGLAVVADCVEDVEQAIKEAA